MTLHNSHKPLNSAIVSSILSLEASSPFSSMYPRGVILNLIVTYSGWVCLCFWVKHFPELSTRYKRSYIYQADKSTCLSWPNQPVSKWRSSEQVKEPWPHPNVLWVPVCRHQTWLHTWLHQTYLIQLLLGLLLMKSLKPIFKWQVAVSSSLFYISAVDLLDYGEYFGKMFRGLKTGYSPFRVTVPTHHLYKQWIQSPWGPFMSWSWAWDRCGNSQNNKQGHSDPFSLGLEQDSCWL